MSDDLVVDDRPNDDKADAWYRKHSSMAPPLVVVLGVMLTFELLSRSELLLPKAYFPPISEIFLRLFQLVGDGLVFKAVGNTLLGVCLGLGIAILVAVPLGLSIGSSRALYRSTRVLIEFLRPVPSVALIPLAVLLYGNGLESKVFLVTFAALWPILVQTIYGLHDADPVAVDTARSFRLSAFQRIWHVHLPSALPYVVTGIRVSTSIAIILSVTAELVIGSAGLGKEISLSRQVGDVTGMYAVIMVTGLMGWVLNALAMRVERRILFWHQAYRPKGAEK